MATVMNALRSITDEKGVKRAEKFGKVRSSCQGAWPSDVARAPRIQGLSLVGSQYAACGFAKNWQ